MLFSVSSFHSHCHDHDSQGFVLNIPILPSISNQHHHQSMDIGNVDHHSANKVHSIHVSKFSKLSKGNISDYPTNSNPNSTTPHETNLLPCPLLRHTDISRHRSNRSR
mmetsp:Transcript_853/g.1838  ORF Transcript_853/g.1838 Transcript_853/m.1838 type:complete len:108 (-) Transcript_853:329-652(-)